MPIHGCAEQLVTDIATRCGYMPQDAEMLRACVEKYSYREDCFGEICRFFEMVWEAVQHIFPCIFGPSMWDSILETGTKYFTAHLTKMGARCPKVEDIKSFFEEAIELNNTKSPAMGTQAEFSSHFDAFVNHVVLSEKSNVILVELEYSLDEIGADKVDLSIMLGWLSECPNYLSLIAQSFALPSPFRRGETIGSVKEEDTRKTFDEFGNYLAGFRRNPACNDDVRTKIAVVERMMADIRARHLQPAGQQPRALPSAT